jgi:hypothetical protein
MARSVHGPHYALPVLKDESTDSELRKGGLVIGTCTDNETQVYFVMLSNQHVGTLIIASLNVFSTYQGNNENVNCEFNVINCRYNSADVIF